MASICAAASAIYNSTCVACSRNCIALNLSFWTLVAISVKSGGVFPSCCVSWCELRSVVAAQLGKLLRDR